MAPEKMDNLLDEFIGREIVVETDTTYMYIGVLSRYTRDIIELTQTDSHNNREIHRTLEQHLNDVVHIGITPNRKRILIMRNRAVSITLLDDVVKFD